MSVLRLSKRDEILVWAHAGGRCEYPGCNDLLWRDALVGQVMNRAYLAHIVGERGPRAEPGTSEALARDPDNIMLLCDTHHRLIDREGEAEHSADALRRAKRHHEDRIERLTAIQAQHKTHILLFGSRIQDHSGLVCFDQARNAVAAAGRYPVTERGIRIDLADAPLDDADPGYYELVEAHVQQTLARTVADGIGPTGHPINHLSVFALATIPALVAFGKALGDIVAADIYQRHRGPEDWTWTGTVPDGFDFHVRAPDDIAPTVPEHVAVSISVTAPVSDRSIEAALGTPTPVYELSVPLETHSPTVIESPDQVELFSSRWRALLTRIKRDHGPDCSISLFPAVPVSIAVQLGRVLLPKADPPIRVYDYRRDDGGFRYALTV